VSNVEDFIINQGEESNKLTSMGFRDLEEILCMDIIEKYFLLISTILMLVVMYCFGSCGAFLGSAT